MKKVISAEQRAVDQAWRELRANQHDPLLLAVWVEAWQAWRAAEPNCQLAILGAQASEGLLMDCAAGEA